MANNHFDARRASRLENPERLAELKVDKLLSNFIGITKGTVCVDIGSGTGVFSFAIAELVGENGIVYAVDDSNDMLDYIRNKKPPQNMVLVHGDAGDTGLKSESTDICFLAFILHEINTPERIINEAYRLLKPGGKVVVLEWKAKITPKGPPLEIRITKDVLEQLFAQPGFTDFRYTDWSVNHYVAVGTKGK